MTGKDTLMNLIDEYAEVRHINGCWVYNTKTAAARQAVIEALSGVQALSAGPAEQQVASSAVLKAIREANMQLVRTGDDAFMLVPYKRATAEQQAAPKAAPTLPEGWTDCTIEFGNDGPEVVAYGPKRMMNRLAKWLGKYFAQVIADAATKAAPGEPVHGDVLPPVGSRVYIRHGRDKDAHACTVTGYYAWGDLGGDKRLHRVFVRLVYEGTDIQQTRMLCDCYSTAEAALAQAAPQQEAQEPALFVSAKQLADLVDPSHATGGSYLPARKTSAGLFTQPLYTAPQQEPAPLSADVVKDAARWRMVVLIGNEVMLHPEKRTQAAAVKAYMDATHSGLDLTGAVDAALAAQKGTP